MPHSQSLIILQKIEAIYYKWYCLGLLDKYEYLSAIKPIDSAIDSIEMSICMDIDLKGRRNYIPIKVLSDKA